MVGMIPAGELDAAADITTGANIDRPLSNSQKAVDKRVNELGPAIIASHPDVAAAAEAAVDNAVAGLSLVPTTRGVLPNGTDLNDLRAESQAGSWRLLSANTYVNSPLPAGSSGVLIVTATDNSTVAKQEVASGTEAWWREASSASTWNAWAQYANADDLLGMLVVGDAQVYATNRVPNPLGVGITAGPLNTTTTTAGVSVVVATTLTPITTGLPAGATHGVEGARTYNSSPVQLIATYDIGDRNASEYAIPVTPGEVISVGAQCWVGPVAGATEINSRVRVRFWRADGTELSTTGDTSTQPHTPSTWQWRFSRSILVPANAARVSVQIVINAPGATATQGSITRFTNVAVVTGSALNPEDYGDGTRRLWSFAGKPHQSPSVRIFRTDQEEAAITAMISGGQSSPVSVNVSGNDVTVTQRLGAQPLVTTLKLDGSLNAGLNIESITLNGAAYQNPSDDITPIRTQMGTVGANHGFTCIGIFNNPDGKTIADVGSVWTDGSREYVLLDITTTGRLKVGGSYTGGGATPVESANVAPTVSLTHVAGATHTGTIDHTTLTPGSTTSAGTQLTPGTAQRHRLTILVDGTPTAGNGAYGGRTVTVRESYVIVDYASLYDLSKANIGVKITQLPVKAAVLVQNDWTWHPGGLLTVEHALDEIAPTTLGACGAVQAQPLTGSGATVTRYIPGVGTAGGKDWGTGVLLDSYASNILIPASARSNSREVPAFSFDVLSVSGNAVVGFAMGYLTNRRSSDARGEARVVSAASQLWDMRSTRKCYPAWTASKAAGWGHVEVGAFRAHLDPAQVAAVLAVRTSAVEAAAALAAAVPLSIA